jgi:predicted nucleic acid-binding protein
MSRSFVDTNILIYLVSHESDQDAATKSAKAREFIGRTEGFLISVQVLNEFTTACLAKQLVDASSVQGHVKRFCRFFRCR